jgi:hypothetical protein
MQKMQLPITLDSNQIALKWERAMNTKSTTAVNEENKPSRRKFFIGAGATVGAVAVVSQTPLGKAVIQEIGSTVKGKDDGYQLSAHIRKYYETTML